MFKRFMGLVLAATIILCFVSCSKKPADSQTNTDVLDYQAAVAKWKNNDFSHFYIEYEADISQNGNEREEKVTEDIYSSSDGNTVTSYYRYYTLNTENKAIRTQYASNEYFDGKYYFLNQNGEYSYEEYLATDFVKHSRLCTRNLIFDFTDEQIKEAQADIGDGYTFYIQNGDSFKDIILSLLHFEDRVDVSAVSISKLEVEMHRINNELSSYDIDVKFSSGSTFVDADIDVKFIGDSGEVLKPTNLADYLGSDEKQHVTQQVEKLFDGDKPVGDYKEKTQAIVDQYGDAGQQIIQDVEQKHHITASGQPTSSTAGSSDQSSGAASSELSENSSNGTSSNTVSVIVSESSSGGIDIEFIE